MLNPYTSPIERLWYYALRIICTLVLLFLVLPVLVIVPLSFNSGSFLVYPLQGFSLQWYQDFFNSAEWMRALKNSMIVAPAATLLAMGFGTLAAIGLTRGNFPGKDPDEFLQALASLPVPDIHDVIREAEPLSEVFTFRMPGSRRTHYDRLKHWPEGLLVVGDALSSMNPLYSQGMTIAALEADCIDERLDALLDKSLRCHQLQGLLCSVVDGAWNMATTEDFRFPETSGERTWRTRFDHWYGAGLGALSANNRRALETQISVTNLVMDPARVYSPAIVSRIALNALLSRNTRQ